MLLDVDGPLTTGFVEFVCSELQFHGIPALAHLVDDWDPMNSFNTPDDVRQKVRTRLVQANVAGSFTPRAGAADFVAWARQHAAVYAVTSSWDSPFWTYERTRWLCDHLHFHQNQVVHAHDKFIVYGDVLVDDKPANVMEWQEAYPNGLAVLWRMGHNAKHVWPVEVSSLEELRVLLAARWGV